MNDLRSELRPSRRRSRGLSLVAHDVARRAEIPCRLPAARSTYNNATNAAFEYGDAEASRAAQVVPCNPVRPNLIPNSSRCVCSQIEHVDAAHEEER